MSETVWMNGRFVPTDEAAVSVSDGGWLHGAGLFETMRCERGIVFRFARHMERLARSCTALLRPADADAIPSAEQLQELAERNGLYRARIRLTVTTGVLRSAAESDEPALTVVATASPLTEYPQQAYDEGVGVVVSRFRQSVADPIAGHKSTCYLPRLVALREAQQARRFEALWFTTNHHLAEGCISNVFLMRDDILRTPGLDTPVLPGIARATVIELAQELGITVQEGPLTIDDLLGATEVLLTNVMLGVLPVVAIERHAVGDGRVGSAAKRLKAAFDERVRRECGS